MGHDRLPADFVAFCHDAHAPLVRALTHVTGDRGLAEEFAQEALIRAGDRWERVGRLDSPLGWAFHVGANLARSRFRRLGAERRALQRHGAAPAHHDPDAADAVAVRAALDLLSPVQREAVLLRHDLGLSAAEAGEVLGRSAGAVRVLTHRALARMRAALDVSLTEEESRHA